MQEKEDERRDVSVIEIQQQVTRLRDELQKEREKNAVKLRQVITILTMGRYTNPASFFPFTNSGIDHTRCDSVTVAANNN